MNSYVFDVLIADNTVNELEFVAQFNSVNRQSAFKSFIVYCYESGKDPSLF
jgi:hypothetical protein